MVEVEDEYWESDARMPKSKKFILEEIEDGTEIEEDFVEVSETRLDTEEAWKGEDLPPAPEELNPVKIPPVRKTNPGQSAVGISVLSVKGWIDDVDNAPVDLRLDSCADISLVSEDYLRTLKRSPAVREGRKMSLAQLTDGGTSIKGYVRVDVLTLSKTGDLLSVKAHLSMAV
jgi:hypothetical protein